MRKIVSKIIAIAFLFLFIIISCKNDKQTKTIEITSPNYKSSFDSTLVDAFFEKYPQLNKYKSDVKKLYRNHQYHYVWYDKKGINEFGNVLYNKINNLEEEGIQTIVPYKTKLDQIYENSEKDQAPNIETELLNSSLYFFYAITVYHGLDSEKSNLMEWHLPRKKQSYVSYLDSLLTNPSLINKNEKGVIKQYFLLKKVLQKYRQIEKNGGWKSISIDTTIKSYKIGDSSKTIAQIRTRLFISGDIETDSKKAIYDKDLAKGILKYKQRRGYAPNTIILPSQIKDLNIPVTERIKTIMVNMERCRWISNDITKTKELIAINIPAYQLIYFKDGKPVLRSNVVVGKVMNKTAIFSAPMKYIVFSPYWNVPESILKKEILPEIAKNENYLAEHNMEWYKDYVRQKPGPENSLGLIKFLFPNSNAIYLHDTPAKSLFDREDRAFSHGCIRVAKPRELAIQILQDDPKWTPEKIEEAMNSGKETWYTLKNKIPVYISYFTAWVDEDGIIHFYDDVYKRDDLLASMLFIK